MFLPIPSPVPIIAIATVGEASISMCWSGKLLSLWAGWEAAFSALVGEGQVGVSMVGQTMIGQKTLCLFALSKLPTHKIIPQEKSPIWPRSVKNSLDGRSELKHFSCIHFESTYQNTQWQLEKLLRRKWLPEMKKKLKFGFLIWQFYVSFTFFY